jgi:hypothetical protein
MLKLDCPSCGRQIAAADIHLERTLAKCVACNTVFNFAHLVAAPGVDAPLQRPRVPPPPRWQVDDWGSDLRIRWRWWTPVALFLLFFCVAWDSFLVFWYAMALGKGGPPGDFQWIAIVFPIAHVAVGVGLTYVTLALLLNRTTVRVSGGRLTVRHGPIPWGGNGAWDAHDIEQLYCAPGSSGLRRMAHSARHAHHGAMGVGHYDLCALLRDGTMVRLLRNIAELDHAVFLEQKLEEFLGIADRRVPGEVDG